MNQSHISDGSNHNSPAKSKAVIPIAGVLLAAALLSGLLSIIGSETATAQQQNMTAMNATAMNATAMNATAMNATAMNATAMNATAMNATAMNATAMNATAMNATAMNATPANPATGMAGG